MTADPATTLAAHADVTDQHGRYVQCRCGAVFDPGTWRRARIAHAEHQLSVLSATHAIIELPEHRVIEVWAERRDEISWRCQCGLVHKHIPLPAHVNIGTALVCANQPKGEL